MNEMKSRIFGIVAVCLVAGLITNGLVLNVSAADSGDIVDEYRGVNAKSNGQYTQTGTGEWQCVEYVDRFYNDAMGVVGASDWKGHGYQYYGMASTRGLRAYEKGKTVFPRPDDILCFSGGNWGHVAIITGVDDNYVYIIEQNWNQNYAREKLPWDKTSNTINKRGSCTVQGWLRTPKAEIRTHPDGALIKGTDGKIYQLQNGQKRHIASLNVFDSWNFKWDQVITVSQQEFNQYPEGEKIVFKCGTLIGDQSTGKVYVIEREEKRQIVNRDAFNQLGYNKDNIKMLNNQNELNLCPDGNPLYYQYGTVWHPRGTLIKGSGPDIYEILCQSGKWLIPTANVFETRFDWDLVVNVPDYQLNQYPTVPRIGNQGFADGTLIRYENDLYVISNNQRRHIKTPEIRDILGYTWTHVSVTYEEFYLHQQGEDITKENSVEYPFVPEIPPSKPSAAPNKYLSADLNCDGIVNLADNAILMSFWGKDPSGANSCQSPDINQDGKVDLVDKSIMMSQWTDE